MISTDWSLDAEQDWYEISLPELPIYSLMNNPTSYIHPSTLRYQSAILTRIYSDLEGSYGDLEGSHGDLDWSHGDLQYTSSLENLPGIA